MRFPFFSPSLVTAFGYLSVAATLILFSGGADAAPGRESGGRKAAPAARKAAPSRSADPESTAPERAFSFLHLSDVHIEPAPTTAPESLDRARSYAGVQSIARLDTIGMPPYQATAPRASFALVTGDCTEFGYPGATPQVVNTYFDHLGLPLYLGSGNHDNTQVASPEFYRQRHGGQNYSFDSNGCHFVVLNSASLQDPNPSFGEEVVRFLEKDLKSVRPSTPVFVAFHHPLNSSEFASPYDTDRILDAVRRHNVVLMLVGHGHVSVKHDYAGIDGIMGGSTFAKNEKQAGDDGFGVCYVNGNRLLYAYHPFEKNGATRAMLDKPIPPYSDYPAITITSPADGSSVSGSRLALAAGVAGTTGTLTDARWNLDDETSGPLKVDGEALYSSVDISALDPGAHYLRLTFKDDSGRQFQRSVSFYLEPEKSTGGKPGTGRRTADGASAPDDTTTASPRARWRYDMGAASKATPLVAGGRVYVGANDGRFRALDAKSGKLIWQFDAEAEILTTAAAFKDLVLFGAGNGRFYALKASTGKPAWTFDAGSAVFSSPVIGPDGEVFFGTNQARLVALDAATGKLLWRNEDALYSIETPPTVDGDRVYFGAWDGYLYAADRKSGKTLWKKPGASNQARVIRYLAPADAPVVLADGRLLATDRGYLAASFDPATGDMQTTFSADCAALAPASDGRSFYVRGGKAPFSRISLDGAPLWQADFVPGRIPVPPTEADGRVYVCTNRGELHALDAETGRTLWKYRVTPKLYVMSAPAVTGDTVYTTGFDGVVTAIAIPGE